jgi:diguanylate cyclase (GGDEF)-like protein/PAS domain S-box-containing protein
VLKPFALPRSKRLLVAGFGALLVLITLVTLVGMTRIHIIDRRIGELVHEENSRTTLLTSLLTVNDQRQQLIYALFTARGRAEREAVYSGYRALGADVVATLGELEKLDTSAPERAAVKEVFEAMELSEVSHERVAQLVMRGDIRGATALLLSQTLATHDRFEMAVNRLIDSRRAAMVAVIAQASADMRLTLILIAIAGVLVLIIGAAVAVRVVRQTVRSEDALHREKELAEVTLHSIADGVITLDAEGNIDYMNPVAEAYTGWKSADAAGRSLEAVYCVLDTQTGAPIPHPGGHEVGARGTEGMAVTLVGRGGNACAIRDSSAPIHNSDGHLVGWVVVFHDVSQIQEMAQQLSWQASHDALTGLFNRREFERRLAGLIEAVRVDDKQHAMLYMDLDNFKTVNDTCGHAAGDELLRQLTTVMQSRMRGSDTLARLGGDEFGVLLEACPLDQAVRIANGLREAVRDFRFIWQDKTFGIGVSAGLVTIDGMDDVGRILANADATCYEAKSKGRDRVQVYRPEHEHPGEQNADLHMVSEINHAFESGNFRLYRQKIIALDVDADADFEPHYEILVRMVDRSGSLVAPSGFMAAAERYNLLSSIERWVISSLVEFLHRQCESGAISREHAPLSGAFYAVNLSGVSINDASFIDFLRQLLTRFELPRGLLCFEVTETTAISNLNKAANLMHELKGMGCRFALDDFGIGMSSFAYLKYLPVDYIKIDGVFVRDMADDPMDQAIVEAINRIAHILGMKTVAEFVEDANILEWLRVIGVDYAQGYFVAKPEALVKTADATPAVLEPI